MRIGLVLDDALDSPDGVQQYVLRVADWMRAHGHEVHFIVGDTKRQDLENLYSIGRNVSVEFNGNTLSMPLPAQRSQLQALLGKLKLDVLHVQTPYSPFMGGRLIDLVDDSVAVVGTFHILPYSVLSTMGSRVLGAWNGRTAKRFDAMMATSVPAQQFAERYYGLSSVVVPNGFDMETFTAGKPAHSRKQIKYLGRLVARKGPLELAKAVGLLYDRGDWPKGWQVVIAGKGKLLPKLRALIESHGLHDIISLPGFIAEDAKANYLADADIAAFPSTAGESFGISLLEGMAGARGVVLAGDNPGYRSVMSPFEDQLLNPKDTESFAAALLDWMRHDAKRRTRAKQQKDYVKRYDMNIVGQQVEDVYKSALQKRQGS